MERAERRAFQAVVHGRVQGVGFRYSAIREANRLGIRGTVRNTAGGDVEVFAEADDAALALFAAWLREGPPGARVWSVDLDWVAPTGRHEGFEVEF
ncbi:MAG: acylphosphatase [Spirochaetes bacterium]|nr:acylphosphatase [Spirochaetota bacterium]